MRCRKLIAPLAAGMAWLIFASAVPAGGPAYVHIPLAGPQGMQGFTLAGLPAVAARMEIVSGQGDRGPVLRMAFQSSDRQRRLVALQAQPAGPLERATALVLGCRVETGGEAPPPLVVIAFERDGGAWYRLAAGRPPGDRFTTVRISLKRPFTRALFATDADQTVRWEQVERIWVGLLLDGPVAGSFELAKAELTDKPFRPAGPVAVTGTWSVSHDPAVRGRLSTLPQGPGGQPCMKYAFEMPGRRHMYIIPRLPVPVEELDSYGGLRFTYQATLPAGLPGLLVMLIEADGTQYYADPLPAASESWSTVTIPFARFRRGGWSADENDRLDLDQVRYVAVGTHGTAQAETASGTIVVAGVQFVP